MSRETFVNNFAHLEKVYEFSFDVVYLSIALAFLGEGHECGVKLGT